MNEEVLVQGSTYITNCGYYAGDSECWRPSTHPWFHDDEVYDTFSRAFRCSW
jgi:hypothetical protein